MNILITGARGFIGKNLRAALEPLSERRQWTLFPVDVDTSAQELEEACRAADFVFHLAGVNRPQKEEDFQRGNGDFTRQLLERLEGARRPAVLLSSSTQAALENPYGLSKRSAEEAVRAYGQATGAPVYVYRLTNAFGKWSRPHYNSAVATFCHSISRGLPIQINDPAALLRLIYIDDIVEEFLRALEGRPAVQGDFCVVQPEYSVTLEALANQLRHFRDSRDRLDVVDQSDPFVRKLHATYLSFLPEDDFARPAQVNRDRRGSFTELLHLGGYGQVSVNVILPRITKGEHWHHTKHEKFIVLSGQGVIRFRRADGSPEVLTYPVSGDPPAVVDIPPGYTHNIENTGDSPMLTLMWANEALDPDRPDTFHLPVELPPG